MKIKKEDIRVCSKCNGEGTYDKSSHDCWGRCEVDTYKCGMCAGIGVILNAKKVEELKKMCGL